MVLSVSPALTTYTSGDAVGVRVGEGVEVEVAVDVGVEVAVGVIAWVGVVVDVGASNVAVNVVDARGVGEAGCDVGVTVCVGVLVGAGVGVAVVVGAKVSVGTGTSRVAVAAGAKATTSVTGVTGGGNNWPRAPRARSTIVSPLPKNSHKPNSTIKLPAATHLSARQGFNSRPQCGHKVNSAGAR